MNTCEIIAYPAASCFLVQEYFEINRSTIATTVACKRDEDSCCPHCNQPIDAHRKIDLDLPTILRNTPQEREGAILSLDDVRLRSTAANDSTPRTKQPSGEDANVADGDMMEASVSINRKRHRDIDDETTRKKRACDEPNPLCSVSSSVLQDQQVWLITKYLLFHSILISRSLVLQWAINHLHKLGANSNIID